MTTSLDIVAVAHKLVGPNTWYRLGAEVSLDQRNFNLDDLIGVDGIQPLRYVDCSEFTEAVCWITGVWPKVPDGAWQQAAYCRRMNQSISISEAIKTPGALLFKDFGSIGAGGRGNHVAISLGDGTCIEARSSTLGVGVWSAYGRGWNYAARILGVNYEAFPPPLPPPTIEVRPMYDPPWNLRPIVASCDCPTGGTWVLADDWSVYTFGTAPFWGHAGGKLDVVGRTPAIIRFVTRPDGQPGYECVATSGEVYGMQGVY